MSVHFLNSTCSTNSLYSTMRKCYLKMFVRVLVLCKIVHLICFYVCGEFMTNWIISQVVFLQSNKHSYIDLVYVVFYLLLHWLLQTTLHPQGYPSQSWQRHIDPWIPTHWMARKMLRWIITMTIPLFWHVLCGSGWFCDVHGMQSRCNVAYPLTPFCQDRSQGWVTCSV
jgi:hypothetical protein